MQIDTTEEQRRDAERAIVAFKNYNSLIDLMGQYNILIPARSMHLWRPTLRVKGDINGVHETLELIATDGILGWFITHDNIAWCGHIQCFSGDIKPLHSLNFVGPMNGKTKTKRIKQKSKRTLLLESI